MITTLIVILLIASLIGFYAGIWHQYSDPFTASDLIYLAGLAQYVLTCTGMMIWLHF